jgi:glycosyltransferase involved in cell wall biosynthesis
MGTSFQDLGANEPNRVPSTREGERREGERPREPNSTNTPEISFVVIGYNEVASLGACLHSVHGAQLEGIPYELIYVDGGSTDGSIAVAKEVGVDQLLGGEKRRRAAENRNLGLASARGTYVQFLDGDMILEPDWPQAAREVMESKPEVMVVWGQMLEANRGLFYQALQMDWEFADGPSLYCGGAALFRREPLQALGGFPEDVAYGEEPYLCWRIRNEQQGVVWHLHQIMVAHDLNYGGFGDYWRRNVRCGETFAEIAHRCWHSNDPLWKREVMSNLVWGVIIIELLLFSLLASGTIQMTCIAILIGIIARKWLQYLRRGKPAGASFIYALHTYLSKLAIAGGIVRWGVRHWGKGRDLN